MNDQANRKKDVETLPRLAMICAMDERRGIGRGNALLWRLPADMKWFRQKTLDKTVLMGRNTFDSIGVPLKRRRNVVLTSRLDFAAEGCETVHSVEEALELIRATSEEVYVIGGGQVYEQFLPYAERLVLTRLHHTFEADAYFPSWNEDEWELIELSGGETTTSNPFAFSFCEYRRRGT